MIEAGAHVASLTQREREVATAYVDGSSYKTIARLLDISPATVRTHLRSVYRKLAVTSKLELASALAEGAAAASPGARDSDALVAELALELDEAMRRERVLAQVLRIISQQGTQLDDVIDAVLDHALELCEAEFGVLFEYRGEMRYRAMRSRNIAPAFADWLAGEDVFEAGPDTGLGRVATSLEVVNIADVRGEGAYQARAPLRMATADLGKARSFAAIPMLSGDRLIGAFTVYRTRVHPFNDRALELAQLFADQACIAIDNARMRGESARAHGGAGPPLPGDTAAADVGAPPLLAVLPFQPVDEGDAGLALVGRQLAAALIMELSASALFRVIDQTSAFSTRLAGHAPDAAAALLGADLVSSGSLRRTAGGGHRVALCLHEAGCVSAQWTELFESSGADVDPLLETLLGRLCAAIGTGIERRLVDAARARRSVSATATEHFLHGLELHHRHGKGDFLAARTHFASALDLDPGFARAAAALAITYVREWFWDSTRSELLDAAERHARTATGLAPHDAWAQTAWGVVALYRGRHADAAPCFERAMELAPYDAYVVSRCALGKLYDGDFDSAIELFRRSIELDPLHADRQRGMLGHALFHAGRYDDAIACLEQIEAPLAWELAWLASSHAARGDSAAAEQAASRLRAGAQAPSPDYRVETRPFRREADRRRLEEAMRAAGLDGPMAGEPAARP